MLTFRSSRRVVTPPAPYDRWLIFLVVCLLVFGLLMVTSASIVIADQQFHQPFYFFYHQLVYILLGIALGSIIVQFDVATWKRFDGLLLIGALLLLALVLFPGIGRSVNGSIRWIGVGVFSIQVSEVAKFAVVVYMAGYLVRHNASIKTSLSSFLKPLGLLAIAALLLLREPDFGAAAVIITTSLGMMFLAGMRLRYFLLLMGVVIVILSGLAISAPYRMARLTTFLNPWANPFDSGYQLIQSLIGFGRGGWFGVGLGKSIQKLFYLPEAHTDFLFSVIAEELGFVGMLTVITLFTLLVWRIFYIGKQSQQIGHHFSGFVAYGLGLWIAIQFIVSTGVNSGLLPTKGLTLPLVSYGGSSMLISCIAMALLMRIDYENRMIRLGLRDDDE